MMDNWLVMTWDTVKDKLKLTVLLSLVFSGLAAMYVVIYPYFEESLEQFSDMPMGFIRGYEELTSFVGYLNMEMYQVMWVLIFAALVAYVSASLISED